MNFTVIDLILYGVAAMCLYALFELVCDLLEKRAKKRKEDKDGEVDG